MGDEIGLDVCLGEEGCSLLLLGDTEPGSVEAIAATSARAAIFSTLEEDADIAWLGSLDVSRKREPHVLAMPVPSLREESSKSLNFLFFKGKDP